MLVELGEYEGHNRGERREGDLSPFLPAYVKHRCCKLTSIHALPVSVKMCRLLNTCEEEFALCNVLRNPFYHNYIKNMWTIPRIYLSSFQKAKRKLITTTIFSKGRLQKLLNSLALLTHDAEKEKSFASKTALGQIFKRNFIDVNTAFALTNQIKLTRVFEMAATALSNLRRLFGDQE